MERKPIIFVGETNPYGDPGFALYQLPRHASGNLLRMHLGLSDDQYDAVDKCNLCDGKWSMPEARKAAADLIKKYEVVVALGRKVGAAFGLKEFFGTAEQDGATVVLLPHPSGLNRMWDDQTARPRTRQLLARLAPSVPFPGVSP